MSPDPTPLLPHLLHSRMRFGRTIRSMEQPQCTCWCPAVRGATWIFFLRL